MKTEKRYGVWDSESIVGKLYDPFAGPFPLTPLQIVGELIKISRAPARE
jgi:hypothetical protein